MMLAIRDSVTDMSPYVRKTAANAIAKLYAFVVRNFFYILASIDFRLDPELKEELVTIIAKLLADKTIVKMSKERTVFFYGGRSVLVSQWQCCSSFRTCLS